MNRTIGILYWIFTSLFGLSVFAGAMMYLLKHEQMVGEFQELGYPEYLVVVLAVFKLLGLFAFFQNRFPKLKIWAYAGFTFNLLMAFIAHVMVMDNEILNPVIVMFFIGMAFYFDVKKNSISNE